MGNAPVRVGLAWLVVVLLGMLAGCSASDNPERAVQSYWDAFKRGDIEGAQKFVISGSEGEVMDIITLDFDTSGKLWTDELGRVFLDRLDLKTTGHTIDGSHAVVDVELTWPDMAALLREFLPKALGELIVGGLSGKSEEELEASITAIFEDALDAAPDVTTPHQVHLQMVDGTWLLASRPVPDMRRVFNLDEFPGVTPTP